VEAERADNELARIAEEEDAIEAERLEADRAANEMDRIAEEERKASQIAIKNLKPSLP